MSERQKGWDWLDDPENGGASETSHRDAELVKSVARCFAGADGKRLLSYLQSITRNRCLGPEASDAQLRCLEGQRQLVGQIEHLIEAGQQRL